LASLVIDHHSGVPSYRQIMDQIRFQIASGALAPNEELPSTRSLSAELSLNPMTISKAYNLLEREGVLERRRGLTLVVRDSGDRALAVGRIDQLRRSLLPAAAVARQLGIPANQAARIFREVLEPTAPHSPQRELAPRLPIPH
jgi:GntR family transcriptional regulator